jgi:hypothetical protein
MLRQTCTATALRIAGLRVAYDCLLVRDAALGAGTKSAQPQARGLNGVGSRAYPPANPRAREPPALLAWGVAPNEIRPQTAGLVVVVVSNSTY